jgi:hypothetical protein
MRKEERDLPPEVVRAIEAWSIAVDVPFVKDNKIRNPDVEKALKVLFWGECDPVRLLSFILGYCTPDPDDQDRKQKPDEFDEKIRKLSEHLASDAEELDQIGPRMIPPINPALAQSMRRVSKRLNEAYESWLEPDMPRGARTGFLVAASELVRLTTGKPHYNELSALVGVFKGPTEPATLRGNVRNFKKRGETPLATAVDIQTEIYWGRKKWDAIRKKAAKI